MTKLIKFSTLRYIGFIDRFKPETKRVLMRRLIRQRCLKCKHTWQAPAEHACPRCHAYDVMVDEVLMTEAPIA